MSVDADWLLWIVGGGLGLLVGLYVFRVFLDLPLVSALFGPREVETRARERTDELLDAYHRRHCDDPLDP